MAKERRPRRKIHARKPAVAKSGRVTKKQTVSEAARPRGVRAPELGDQPHLEAVAVYERGLRALQEKQYGRATQALRSILDLYPEEKELHERARLYLNICERQALPPDKTPQGFDERVYAATLAINAGSYDDGLAQLQALLAEAPTSDHVHYMLAVAHTLRHELGQAAAHLERAIELDPDNRMLAWQDADLELLRQHPAHRAAFRVSSVAKRDRRPGSRSRAAR
jgi:tetratricopeptide (TPR) repeat protein